MQSLRCHASATAIAMTVMVIAPTSIVLADPVADFNRDKSIDLSIGFGPGGGFDSYARLLARHLGNFIPGNPTVIPRNMPGGGGLIAANYLYNVASRDGRSIAIFGPFQRHGAAIRKYGRKIRSRAVHLDREYEPGGRRMRRLAQLRHSDAC
jgi:hypothetical protein